MQIPGGASGSFRCRCGGQVPEGSGADARSGSGGSGAYTQVRIQKVSVQRLGEVPEGSGADPR